MNSDDKMVSFFSFLAGFFLLRRSSTCGELSYLMNDFTNRFNIYIDDDNDWEVYTEDGLPSAQWEIMVLVTEDGNEVLCW